MAQTTSHLRERLEKNRNDAPGALALLLNEAELRSLGWKVYCMRAREAFHAAGRYCGRSPLPET